MRNDTKKPRIYKFKTFSTVEEVGRGGAIRLRLRREGGSLEEGGGVSVIEMEREGVIRVERLWSSGETKMDGRRWGNCRYH